MASLLDTNKDGNEKNVIVRGIGREGRPQEPGRNQRKVHTSHAGWMSTSPVSVGSQASQERENGVVQLREDPKDRP